jgi:hypothetical protein
LDRIIPCSLHLFMGITRKLLKLFAIDFDGEGEATKALIDYLVPLASTFGHRVRRSDLNTQLARSLPNQH